MAEFHFIRPWWLLLFPAGAWLIWRLARGSATAGLWQAWVDEALQPLVLRVADSALRGSRWLLSGAWAACALAVLALAGPTWERLPVPAVRSSEALVVVLDLSRSMDVGDVEPSRLVRAKLKLLSMLQRRDSGQTGLVVFSAHAFTVTPLTTDTRTIAALVSSLSSDIMPSQGSYPEAGIGRAAQLLRQAAASRGEILLVSDSGVSPGALELARELRSEGMTLHVLAVGTAQGGPIPQAGGGFLTDSGGQVVVNRVNLQALQRLAEAGGGQFSFLTPDDRDLDRLFAATRSPTGALAGDGEELRTDIWRDQGVWLVVLLLPLLALSFRRGWVVVWVVALTLPGYRAEALTWADLWQRPDQQGQATFLAGDHARAGELFKDPAWRAAAQYRAGQFESSAETLATTPTAAGHYNRGNALARAGSFAEAVEAYEQALELDPDHEDARFNRDLLLQEPPDQSGGGGEAGESEGGSESRASAQDQGGEQSEASPGEARDSESEQGADAGAGQEQPQDASAEGEPVPNPGDLEEWASEQAAEQWLRRIPEDPGGLLRRKFLYQYQRLGIDQDGNYLWPGDEEQPF